MEIILLEDVEKVGRKGDVVRVRDGFARNFLLPRRLGYAATRANRSFVEEQKTRSAKRREKEKEEAAISAKRLEQEKIVLEAKAGEQDKLFGSITAEEISLALKERGYHVSKKQVSLQEPLRTLGMHAVIVSLFPEVKVTVTVEVVRKP